MIISYALILQNGQKHDGGIQEMESNHLSDAAFETTFVTTKNFARTTATHFTMHIVFLPFVVIIMLEI